MTKLVIAAALCLAVTSAHAGEKQDRRNFESYVASLPAKDQAILKRHGCFTFEQFATKLSCVDRYK